LLDGWSPFSEGRPLNSLWHDVVFGFRTLTKRPAFAVTAIITMALGIGANTAVFSVVYAAMLRRLPVPESGQLVSIVSKSSDDRSMRAISFPDYREYRELREVFVDIAAFNANVDQLNFGNNPERAVVTVTTDNYFSTLGLDAALGRLYGPVEGDLGREPVVVLGHGYWQSRCGGDPSIVGKTLTIDRHLVTVIGVTPVSFPGTSGLRRPAAYVPLSTREIMHPGLRQSLEDRRSSWQVVARLRDGVSVNEAQAAVTTVATRLEREYPVTNTRKRALIYPEPLTRIEPAAASYLPPVAAVLMIMVGLVLLIACANVANLLLSRAAERKREIAVRSALGAGRLRIARQLLVESGIISLGGGFAGLILTGWVGKLLASIRIAYDTPLVLDVSIDLRVLGFAILVSLGAGLLAGLAPALHTARTNLAEALKEGGRSVASGGRGLQLRDLLVIGQVAVSVVLLVGTALLVRSMVNFSNLDFGFETRDRLMLRVDTSVLDYDHRQRRDFFRELLERVRGLPGVRSAATSRWVPMGVESTIFRVFPEERSTGPSDDGDTVRAWCNVIGPGYFETMGIEILDGRDFDEQDTSSSRTVAIINSTMAEQFWPGQDPVGKRFKRVAEGGLLSSVEVVGVEQTTVLEYPGEPPQPGFYLPVTQWFHATRVLLVHAVSNPAGMVPAIRSEIRALDPDTAIYDVRTLESHVSGGKALFLIKLPARMVGISAVIGATLAALGLYAVIAYSISRRTHEIGVRLAMGATPSDIVRLVLSKGLVLAGGGIVLGVLLARLITGRFAYRFVGVGAGDPFTYIAVSMLVLLIALIASYIPARFRAARIEPAVALREE
jgi:predicted permease